MSKSSKKFIIKSKDIAFDLNHREKIKFNISKYNVAVKNGEKRYRDIELARLRGAHIKRQVLANLYDYLVEFEKNAITNGNTVLWASDNKEAIDHVIEILTKYDTQVVVKSKSMTTEEVDFNTAVESIGVKSVETDLGEFIVQVAGEKPYHIVTPAMHKSKEDIATLFHQKFGTNVNATPEVLTNFVRNQLRQNFLEAEVGVTGANFLLADIGGIAVTENEGNAIMSASFPTIHIVIAGIEKVVPSYKDLGLYWPLLASHGTGQQMTVYNSIYLGPKHKSEIDGPEKMYIILLDNGRTSLYDQAIQSESLSCIRCGACLNACPIYKNIGGYTYESTYSGPIGSVITPHFKGLSEFKHLSFACSLCGKCEEVCPVKIPLPKLLLYNRADSVNTNYNSKCEKLVISSFSYVLNSRFNLDFISGRGKEFCKLFIENMAVGNLRSLPSIANNSFSKQWCKQRT